MNNRRLFFDHVGQTSPEPLALEIVGAKGSKLTDKKGKEYIDLIAGISVSNIGHRHPKVVEAIRRQAGKYLHLLVYGELIEAPQVQYARLLCEQLPGSLNMVYFTNSGAEAVEGAMKLAKRYTGRTKIAAFNYSYHGSTQGALSLLGDEYWRQAYRPLLPGIVHLEYNSFESIEKIDRGIAAVFLEPVQAERGVHKPAIEWMQALRHKCSLTGTLLVCDAVQTGFGRTGTLWGFEQYSIVPDIVLLGKALGGGLPLGAFIADRKIMEMLTKDPVLGHITTFGGHPLSCAAGLAATRVLLKKMLHSGVEKKSALFRKILVHPAIKAIRTAGLLIAVEFDSFEINKSVIKRCLEKGLLTDWFLFSSNSMRIAPPLNITARDIRKACAIILESLEEISRGRG